MFNLIFFLLISTEPQILANRDYVPELVKLFDGAEKTIDIIMFSAGYYPEHPEGINRVLYNSLIRAAERGVRVRIILDASSWNPNNTRKNAMVARFFRKSGLVEVYFDPPDVTTHTKAMVVDSTLSVVGSTNWSYYALAHNNETAVLIECKSLGLELERLFTDLLSLSTKEIPSMKEED